MSSRDRPEALLLRPFRIDSDDEPSRLPRLVILCRDESPLTPERGVIAARRSSWSKRGHQVTVSLVARRARFEPYAARIQYGHDSRAQRPDYSPVRGLNQQFRAHGLIRER